jgi:hypothetical protein
MSGRFSTKSRTVEEVTEVVVVEEEVVVDDERVSGGDVRSHAEKVAGEGSDSRVQVNH